MLSYIATSIVWSCYVVAATSTQDQSSTQVPQAAPETLNDVTRSSVIGVDHTHSGQYNIEKVTEEWIPHRDQQPNTEETVRSNKPHRRRKHRKQTLHKLTEDSPRWAEHEARMYINSLFRKYGEHRKMSFEGLEHLMISLGLGNIMIDDHDIHDHRMAQQYVDFHETHEHKQNHHKAKSRVDVPDNHDTNHTAQRYSNRTIEKRSLPEGSHGHDHGDIDTKCISPRELMMLYKVPAGRALRPQTFLYLCPALLYQLDGSLCTFHTRTDGTSGDQATGIHGLHGNEHLHHGDSTGLDDSHNDDIETDHDSSHHDEDNNHDENDFSIFFQTFLEVPGKVWGLALLSVSIISLVGLVCVAIVPVLHKALYDHVTHVLVALAVGTLTGDALLHLLPHSMVPHTPHKHRDGQVAISSHAADNLISGIHGDHVTNHGDHVTSGNHGDDHAAVVYKGLLALGGAFIFYLAERVLAMCSERRTRHHKIKLELEHGVSTEREIGEKLSAYHLNTGSMYIDPRLGAGTDDATDETEPELLRADNNDSDASTVPGNHGDEPGGSHGHSHEAPRSVSSVAWMVIMGDGLHNFTDGLAIGAAFANSLTVGLSTSIAVFCHELPHELGDFAVLLKAGMSVKLALLYNGVSSVLCFLGLVIGVAVGNIDTASSWIFALTAGIFIYIALVDMLPQLTVDPAHYTCCHLVLHFVGLGLGVAIMLVIALYEDRIKVG